MMNTQEEYTVFLIKGKLSIFHCLFKKIIQKV